MSGIHVWEDIKFSNAESKISPFLSNEQDFKNTPPLGIFGTAHETLTFHAFFVL
jgi:hypothetical protein